MVKKAVASIGAVLIATQAIAGNWANVRPAYDMHDQHATVRFEGGSNLTDKLSIYGIVDLDATKQRPLDFEGFSGKMRSIYSLGNLGMRLGTFGVSAEGEFNSGSSDKLRLGLTWNPSLGKGNFTQLRLYTGTANGINDAQAVIYTSQTIMDRFTPNLLVIYNLKQGTMYAEPELDIKAAKKLEVMLQGRIFGALGKKMDVKPVVGLKYSF